MISEHDVQKLIKLPESDRLEKTISTRDTDKFGEAVCAFANDLSGGGLPGYLLIGVEDNGKIAGLRISDEQMRNFSGIRADGNLLPSPTITVAKFSFPEGDVAVLEVAPSKNLPVRYRGKIWVRVGPRKAVANESDERVLRERQKSYDLTFDAMPRFDAKQEDLRIDLFKSHYLPRAVDSKILEEDARSLLQKMAALRFYDIANGCPTNAGLLLFGKNPEYFFFGGYLQYVKFGGTDNSAPILSEFKFSGNLVEMLVKLDSFIETGIAKRRPVPASALREESVVAYPHWAMRELVLNAVMHRDYQANAPIKFYEYSDRVEITNPGGLYGLARPENFPNVNDYRNPIIAEALKVLGYVNRFNRGIALAQKEFSENGNGKILFDVGKQTVFCCSVSMSYNFTHEEETASEVLAETDSGNIPNSASLLSAINSNGTINGMINSNIEPSGTINNEIKIKNLIGTHPGIKRAGLSVKTGISVRTIARILKSLKESGAVEYRGSKKSGGWYPKTKLKKYA